MLLIKDRILLIVALKEESAGLFEQQVDHLIYTGVGKVNASLKLSEALADSSRIFDYVVNLGTAGSHCYAKGDLIQCTHFIQHDMDAQAIGYQPFQTPQEDDIVLEHNIKLEIDLPQATLYTGDSFVTDKQKQMDVIDMEGYALAKVCAHFQKPFICIKFISDGADEQADTSWDEMVLKGAGCLSDCLKQLIK